MVTATPVSAHGLPTSGFEEERDRIRLSAPMDPKNPTEDLMLTAIAVLCLSRYAVAWVVAG